MKKFDELSEQQKNLYIELAKIINCYSSDNMSTTHIKEVLEQLNTSDGIQKITVKVELELELSQSVVDRLTKVLEQSNLSLAEILKSSLESKAAAWRMDFMPDDDWHEELSIAEFIVLDEVSQTENS